MGVDGLYLTHAVCFPLCPGMVDTEMMEKTLNEGGVKLPPDLTIKSVDETVQYVLARIDEATLETKGLVQWDGEVLPW
jgi:hypothetical protein